MATGASPIYYDFEMLEEMQVSTGGADVTQQTGGVGINLVTKSGTDKFKGSARYYYTDDKYQSTNINDTLRRQGATSGNPIQNIKDYGIEGGGPITLYIDGDKIYARTLDGDLFNVLEQPNQPLLMVGEQVRLRELTVREQPARRRARGSAPTGRRGASPS